MADNDDQQISFCNLCSQRAFFSCGNCGEVTYCKLDHQKADWSTHRASCVSSTEKSKRHIEERYQARKQVFGKLARKEYIACEKLNEALMGNEEEFLALHPSKQNQIQYASTLLLHVRIMIIIKDYNKAQDILNNYLTNKKDFIQDISDIPSKIDDKDPNYEQIRIFVLGKIRLISTLANLTHQLIRNSISIVDILIKHIQKFYGPESLELSNCYFETGMYYNYMNQTNKAIGCFLKAGKLRKDNGAGAYCNAAYLLSTTGEDLKALKYYQHARTLFNQNSISYRENNRDIQAFLHQNLGICYSKMDDLEEMVSNFQKALCILERTGAGQHPHFKLVLTLLGTIQSQIETDNEFEAKRFDELPHEKPSFKKYTNINNQDFDLFWNVDKNFNKGQKQEAWRESFKGFRKKFKLEGFCIQPPQVIEKYLKSDRENQYLEEEEARNGKLFYNAKDARPAERIEINIQFMRDLSAIQVDYLNQLSNILENKEKAAIYDAVQGGNFINSLPHEKKLLFYKLNPRLVRPLVAKRHNLGKILDDDKIDEKIDKPKVVTPRLNLSNLPNRF